MNKKIFVCLFIFLLPYLVFAQCNFQEKYQNLICELDKLIKVSYDTISSDFGNPISEKMRSLNEKNCNKIDNNISSLEKEFKSRFPNRNFELDELTGSYISSLKIYSQSLRTLTAGDEKNYLIYYVNACTNNYQQSENAKNNLLLYLNYQAFKESFKSDGTYVPDEKLFFQAGLSFGFFSSSLQDELTGSFSEEGTEMSFRKLNMNFNLDYHVSNKFSTGFGVSTIPETGASHALTTGRAETRLRGTSVNMHGTYFPWNTRDRGTPGRGIEVGLTIGIVTNLLVDEAKVFFADTSHSFTVYQHIDYDSSGKPFPVVDSTVANFNSTVPNELNFKSHPSSLGVFLSPVLNIYLNKYFSLQASVSFNINNAITLPEKRAGNAIYLPEQDISFSSFSAGAGIALHF